jgi:hypothetical protein
MADQNNPVDPQVTGAAAGNPAPVTTDNAQAAPVAAPETPVQAAPVTPAAPAGEDRHSKAALRRAEREAGKRKLQDKLDREAQSMGYRNHADLLEQTRAARATKQAEQPAKAEGKPQEANPETHEEPQAATAEAMRKHISTLENQNSKLQRELRMLRKEQQMRDLCYKHGVKDIEYAVSLIAKAASEKGEFNADTFFRGMRKERPYLFGDVPMEARPATTTADTAPAPTPGKTERVTPPRKSAKEMTPDEYRKWKAKHVGARHPFG